MDLGLEGRVAIVTGGAGAIGFAICERMAQEGAKLVIVDIDLARAESQAAAIKATGGDAIARKTDIVDAASVKDLVTGTLDAFGRIDILVNNAGFQRDKRIVNMSDDDWDSVVDVILKGAFVCSRAVIPHMIERKWGRIVNMSSRAHLGNAGQANYSAGKAGLLGFSRALALENGRHGITVNSVAPGIVDTPAIRALPHFEKFHENAEKTTPIPRMGTVADVADGVAFLASERASYVSGEVLHITGGRY
ncbi:MAG: 3-oxoacyl-[acyl-carrier-protein] reductase [Gammaproteobacteria bacterium]|nr:3-oxoacyl-[acyl-carrier-protein] reductase [Gammaproteobacteria bacterium]